MEGDETAPLTMEPPVMEAPVIVEESGLGVYDFVQPEILGIAGLLVTILIVVTLLRILLRKVVGPSRLPEIVTVLVNSSPNVLGLLVFVPTIILTGVLGTIGAEAVAALLGAVGGFFFGALKSK